MGNAQSSSTSTCLHFSARRQRQQQAHPCLPLHVSIAQTTVSAMQTYLLLASTPFHFGYMDTELVYSVQATYGLSGGESLTIMPTSPIIVLQNPVAGTKTIILRATATGIQADAAVTVQVTSGLTARCEAPGSTSYSCQGLSPSSTSCTSYSSCVGTCGQAGCQAHRTVTFSTDVATQIPWCARLGTSSVVYYTFSGKSGSGLTSPTPQLGPGWFAGDASVSSLSSSSGITYSSAVQDYTMTLGFKGSTLNRPVGYWGVAAYAETSVGSLTASSQMFPLRLLVAPASITPHTMTALSPAVYSADAAALVTITVSSVSASATVGCKYVLCADSDWNVCQSSPGSSEQFVVGTYVDSSHVRCAIPKRADFASASLTNLSPYQWVMIWSTSYLGCSGTDVYATAPVVMTLINACDVGYYMRMDFTGCDACPTGRYRDLKGGVAPASTACFSCPAGRYGATTGLSTSSCSGLCTAGYYCRLGSASATQYRCAGGYYGSNQGNSDAACDGVCAAGYYCPSGSTSATQYACPAGRWGGTRQSSSSCSGECMTGYYCPAASTSSTQTECGTNVLQYCGRTTPATAYCGYGKGAPDCLNPGEYSSYGTETTRQQMGGAWTGRYAMGDGPLRDCPAGKYGASNLLSTPQCSGNCQAGYRCAAVSATPTFERCIAGLSTTTYSPPQNWYCVAGTADPPSAADPQLGTSAPLQVPAGYYSTSRWGDAYARSGIASCNADTVCVDGTRLPRLEYLTPGWCATNYDARSETYSPSNSTSVSEHAAQGIVVVTTRVRTRVPNQSPAITLANVQTFDKTGAATLACGTPAALLTLTATPNVASPPVYAVTVSTAGSSQFNYELCPGVTFDIRSAVGTYTSSCSLTMPVLNMNDPPLWRVPKLVRWVNELSVQGTDAAGTQGSEVVLTNSQACATAGNPACTAEVWDEDALQEWNYTLTAPSTIWTVSACSGQIKVLTPNPTDLDFETQPVYTTEMRICDDGRPNNDMLCDDVPVEIRLLDVNEPPAFINPSLVFHVDENTPTGTALSPAKPDMVDPDKPICTAQGCPSNNVTTLTLDATSAAGRVQFTNNKLTLLAPVNYELGSFFTIKMQACDSFDPPACSPLQEFTVQVTDKNDAPEILGVTSLQSMQGVVMLDSNNPPSVLATENSAGTAIATLDLRDEDALQTFAVSSITCEPVHTVANPPPCSLTASSPSYGTQQGRWRTTATVQLSLASPLNYEAVALYKVNVTVSDASLSSSFQFILQVADVNEQPSVSQPSVATIAEDAAPGAPVLSATSTPLCLTATDPDVGAGGVPGVLPSAQGMQWSVVAGQDAGLFAITEGGCLALKSTAASLDFESSSSYNVTVRVSDTGEPQQASTAIITVQVTDVNEAPEWAASYAAQSIDEGSTGQVASYTVRDQDMVHGDSLTLELVPTLSGQTTLELVPGTVTGDVQAIAIQVATGAHLDFESATSYTYRIRATDSGGLIVLSPLMQLKVLDVNEPPTWVSPVPRLINMPSDWSSSGLLLGTLAFSDPERSQGSVVTTSIVSIVRYGSTLQSDCDAIFTGSITTAATYSPTLVGQAATPVYGLDASDRGCNLTLRITDNGYTYEDKDLVTHEPAQHADFVLQVRLVERNTPPAVNSTFQLSPMAENTAAGVILHMASSDEQATQVHTWRVRSVVPPVYSGAFSVASTGSQGWAADLTMESPINFEELDPANPRVEVELGIQDNALSALESVSTVIIPVVNVSEPPRVRLQPAQGNNFLVSEFPQTGDLIGLIGTLDEDASDGVVSLQLLAPLAGATQQYDPAWFNVTRAACPQTKLGTFDQVCFELAVVATGSALDSLAAMVNFEAYSELPLRCRATDVGGKTVDAVLAVQVVDVNESPYFSNPAASFQVQEGPGKIGAVAQAFTLMDTDTMPSNQSWASTTMSIIASQPVGLFTVLAGESALRFAAEVDYESSKGGWIVVRVTDGPGLYQDWNTSFEITNINDLEVSAVRSPAQGIATDGSSVLTMQGLNLGFTDDRQATFSLLLLCQTPSTCPTRQLVSACTQQQPRNNTHISCATPAGAGAGYLLRLRVQLAPGVTDQLDIAVDPIDYATPVILSVSGASEMSTGGGDLVTLQGQNFANSLDTALLVVQYKRTQEYARARQPVELYTAMSCVVSQNFTEVQCLSVPGSGAGLRWQVKLAGVSSDLFANSTSYGMPQITNVTVVPASPPAPMCGSDMPGGADHMLTAALKGMNCAGGDMMLLTGINFAPAGTAAYRVELHGGIAAVHRIQPGSAQWTSKASFPAQNGTSIGIVGPQLQVDSSTCTFTHTSMACRTPAGAGYGIAWQLRVSELRSARESGYHVLTHYFAPRLVEVLRINSPPRAPPTDLKTNNPGNIILLGSQFGTSQPAKFAATTMAFTLGTHQYPLAFESTVAVSMQAGTVPGTQQLIMAAPNGFGKNLSATIRVADSLDVCAAAGLPLAAGVGYTPPSVGSIKGTGSQDANTTGGEPVVISGTDFGFEHPLHSIDRVQYFNGDAMQQYEADRAALENVFNGDLAALQAALGRPIAGSPAVFQAVNCRLLVNHTQIVCDTNEGAGDGLQWRVTINEQVSGNVVSKYNLPVVALASGKGAPGYVQPLVNVSGWNFGPSSPFYLEGVYMSAESGDPKPQDYACSWPTFMSPHFQFQCRLPYGFSPLGAALDSSLQYQWKVVVRGLVGVTASSGFWYYAEPQVQGLQLVRALTVAGEPIVQDGDVLDGLLSNGEAPDRLGIHAVLMVPGDNLGVRDLQHVSISLQVGGTELPTEPVPASSLSGVPRDAVTFSAPVGVGTELPVQVDILHSAFPTVLSTLSAGTLSFAAPSISVFEFLIDGPDVAGRAEYCKLEICTDGDIAVVIRGLSFGNANFDSNASSVADWTWGPNISTVDQYGLDTDPHAPFAYVDAAGASQHRTPGWLWTTNEAVQVAYGTAITQYIPQNNNFTSSAVWPVPSHRVSAWNDSHIIARLGQSGTLLMVCTATATQIDVDHCSSLDGFEQVSIGFTEGSSGCPPESTRLATAGGTTVDFTVKIDSGNSTSDVASTCSKLGVRLDFGTEYVAADTVGYTPLMATSECQLHVRMPPGAGKLVRAYLFVGKSKALSNRYCTLRYEKPSVARAFTARLATGVGNGPALRSISRSVVGPYTLAVLPRRANLAFDSPEDALNLTARPPLSVAVPTSGALLLLEGRELGGQAWYGSMPTTMQLPLSLNLPVLAQFAYTIPAGGATPSAGQATPAYASDAMAGQLPGVLRAATLVNNFSHCQVWVPEGSDGAQLMLQVGGNNLEQSIVLRYEPPSVLHVAPATANTTGGATVRITGYNFGVHGDQLRVWFGPYEATGNITLVQAHSSIDVVVPPGQGADLPVLVQVNGRQNLQVQTTFSYLPPEIMAIQPQEVSTHGTDIVTLTGCNFGLPGVYSAAAMSPRMELRATRLGDLHYFVPDRVQELVLAGMAAGLNAGHFTGGTVLNIQAGSLPCTDRIVMRMPQGQGAARDVWVNVGGQRSINSLPVSFEKPQIISIQPGTAPTRGLMVRFNGRSLGRTEIVPSADLQAALLGPAATHTMGVNDQIDMRPGMKPSWRNGLNLSVLLPESSGTVACRPYPNDRINVNDFKAWSLAVTGGLQNDEIGTTRPDYPTMHMFHYCALPHGFGRGLGIEYSLDAIPGNSLFNFSYSSPFVEDASPNTPDANGQENFVLVGVDFGPPVDEPFGGLNNSFKVILLPNFNDTVGYTNCTDPSLPHFTQLQCNLGRLTVGTKIVSLDAANYTEQRFPAQPEPASRQDAYDSLLQNTTDLAATTATGGARALALLDQAIGEMQVYKYESIPKRAEQQYRFRVFSQCGIGSYGQLGEFCEACPPGGNCTAYPCLAIDPVTSRCRLFREPESAEGFWAYRVPVTDESCHEPRKPGPANIWEFGRPYPFNLTCPYMKGCIPEAACAGNNTCTYGYEGDLCSRCLKGKFYRFGGECLKCPEDDMVRMRIIAFCVAILCVCIGGYVLQKYKVHLAFISIGVDYLQVLALLAKSKVAWPTWISDLLRLLSIFSFDIDFVTPECLVPDISYEQKFFFIQGLPLCILLLVLVGYSGVYLYARCKGQKHSKANENAPMLIAMCTLIMYYLYLALVRSVLDVFICDTPAIPDKAAPYGRLAVNPSTACFSADHWVVFIAGCCTFLCYGVMYPVWVYRVLKTNKKKVKTDQLLRAMGIGDTPSTNQYYAFRVKFHKLYYHFKPGKYYWITIVFARKFAIAVTALTFRNTPSFQMAFAFCILFFSFAAQVRHSPYMSMSERREILLNHKEKVRKGNAGHMQIAEAYATAVRNAKDAKTRRAVNMADMLTAELGSRKTFLFDYNSLEATLLFCGSLVCLAAIMMQAGNINSPLYQANRSVLAVMLIVLIAWSLTYFFVVFAIEVSITFGCQKGGSAPCGLDRVLRVCRFGTRQEESTNTRGAALKQQKDIDMEITSGDMSSGIAVNPLALRAQTSQMAGQAEASAADVDKVLSTQVPPTIAQWQMVRRRREHLLDTIAGLEKEVAAAGHASASAGSASNPSPTPHSPRAAPVSPQHVPRPNPAMGLMQSNPLAGKRSGVKPRRKASSAFR